MGQEERKNKAKMEKTQIQLASTSNEYEAAVKALEETTGRWNRDWKAACDVRSQSLLELAEERLTSTRNSKIWKRKGLTSLRAAYGILSMWRPLSASATMPYVYLGSRGKAADFYQSCEKIRLALEKLEIESEIAAFIQEQGTGQEIPDPPKYINFCRGDVDDTASEVSEAESYSVAQFQRTINPAFRTSSPQPATLDSHHDPNSYQSPIRKSHPNAHTPPSRETTLTPQRTGQQPPPQLDYMRQPASKPPQKMNADDFAPVPHNEYPADGMTMFCRTTAPPSDRSSVVSPVRRSSRDSQSDYSNPTSMSSVDPVNGKQSPIKQFNGSHVSSHSPEKSIQKKRSGFFSNSPFRRKSKHEKDGRQNIESRNSAAPQASATWGPSAGRDVRNQNPTRPYGSGNSRHRMDHSVSPEPVDPRASFQLNVGNNVFDVASPDAPRNDGNKSSPLKSSPQKDVDPIAQALADLKGVGKQSSTRVSADRYHGIATPGPPSASSTQHQGDVLAGQRGTPPPSYSGGSPAKSLAAPQPAFTSAQMRQTTSKYVGQNQSMYGSSRPGTRNGDVPRAASPLPMRSTSPRPEYGSERNDAGQYRSRQARSASPNPYGGSSSLAKPNNASYGSYNNNSSYSGSASRSSRYNSPSDIRPGSSGQMAMQLADPNQVPAQQQQQMRSRGQNNARPMSYYGGQQAPPSQQISSSLEGRTRSKSVAGGQYTRDGIPILEFGQFYPLIFLYPIFLHYPRTIELTSFE